MLRLLCPDGEAIVPKRHDIIEKLAVFANNPELSNSSSYELHCKAKIGSLNILLGRLYNELEPVTITADNYADLRSLSRELAFSGLDKELQAFEDTESNIPMPKRIAVLEERIDDLSRQNKAILRLLSTHEVFISRVASLEEKLQALQKDIRLSKTDTIELRESVSWQCRDMEKMIADMGKAWERRLSKTVQKMKQPSPVERGPKTFSGDVKELKQPFPVERGPKTFSGDVKELKQPFPVERGPKTFSGDVKELKQPFPVERGPKTFSGDVKELKQSERREDGASVAVSKKKKPRIKRTVTEGVGRLFPYSEVRPLGGIIDYLTRMCGGNVQDNGIVNVTASSFVGNGYPKNAVDLDTDSVYCSKNVKDTWICYDFGEREIRPMSYSLRSYEFGPGNNHLKSWVIEVSTTGAEGSWAEIDRRIDNNALNDCHVIGHFDIAHVPSGTYRFFRLRQIGENHDPGYYYVKLTAFEVFGTLVEKQKK